MSKEYESLIVLQIDKVTVIDERIINNRDLGDIC